MPTRKSWIVFAVALIIDLAIPSTLGAVCGPCSNDSAVPEGCPADLSQWTFYGFVTFLSTVWPHMTYRFGESSLDLWAAAVARWLLYAILCVARLIMRRKPGRAASPMLQPLNAAYTASGAAVPVPHPTSGPHLSAKRAAWIAWGLTALSWTHGTAKAVGRLLQVSC